MTWWMPFQIPTTPAAPQREFGLVDRTETFDLGIARTDKVFYISGIGITIEQNTGVATARFNDPTSAQINLPTGHSIPEIQFTRIYLTNTRQIGDTLTISTRTPADSYYGPQTIKQLATGQTKASDDALVTSGAAAWATVKEFYIINLVGGATINASYATYYRTIGPGPCDWRLQVSTDGGVTWTTVDTVLGFVNVTPITRATIWAAAYTGNTQIRYQIQNAGGSTSANTNLHILGENIVEVISL